MSPFDNIPTGLFGLNQAQPIKRSIFVSFHHGKDQAYYDEFSRFFSNAYDVIKDNSVDREIDSDNADYIMRTIREDYITSTSCTIVLCGQDTPRRKYVDWEIKATLDKKHGLIGVKLPYVTLNQNGKVTVPARLYDNIDSGYAVWTSWDDLSVEALKAYIETANSNSKDLIRNNLDMRKRNG